MRRRLSMNCDRIETTVNGVRVFFDVEYDSPFELVPKMNKLLETLFAKGVTIGNLYGQNIRRGFKPKVSPVKVFSENQNMVFLSPNIVYIELTEGGGYHEND
jgi:hypothetical protein